LQARFNWLEAGGITVQFCDSAALSDCAGGEMQPDIWHKLVNILRQFCEERKNVVGTMFCAFHDW